MDTGLVSQWLNEMAQGNHPEVIRFIEELQMQIQLGRFDDDSGSLKMKETD
jgi:Fe-S-cluster formation regulator IscX/YfhJ